jgi:hypothetical protein
MVTPDSTSGLGSEMLVLCVLVPEMEHKTPHGMLAFNENHPSQKYPTSETCSMVWPQIKKVIIRDP